MVDTSLRQPLIISHNKPQKIKDKLTALPALAYLRICQEVESESHSRATTCRKVENINLAGYLVTYKLQQFSVHAS